MADSELIVEMKKIRDELWKTVLFFRSFQSGCSLHLQAEDSFEKLVLTLDEILYGSKAPNAPQ